ncbi:hypothetical protein COB57_05830 [Candidatus Peregrinibacteria bacterium]|nr:MAG: hypothetical protein COB57_05830 [Candidatus Peregrinibacteria bacterium]
MQKSPLFQYSLTLKVFISAGIFLLFMGIMLAVLQRFQIQEIPVLMFIIILTIILSIVLLCFLYYVTFPLQNIAEQILALLTGKPFQKVTPQSNDEIGVISYFFNTVTDRIQDLSQDIETGKRISSELEIASKIQSDILPKKAPDNIIGLEITAASRACSEVGGDCFDFLNAKDDTYIYIGDVTGHGLPAGIIMILVNTMLKALASEGVPPKDMIAKTNTLLKNNVSSSHFMSFVMLRWQNMKQRMSYIGAGHEYILHYSQKTKTVQKIKSGGIALKMIPNISRILKEIEIPYQEGDSILLYTDGITEGRNPNGEMYGIERLLKAFEQHASRSAEKTFELVTKDFATFLEKNHVQEDDITMIVIKNIGTQGKKESANFIVNVDKAKNKINSDLWSWN